MNRIPLISALLLVFTLSLSAAPFSLTKMGAEETMHVTLSSSGCFHQSTHLFKFTSKKVSIYRVTITNKKKSESQIGQLVLTDDDLVRLDKLFAFYANGQEKDGCTTIDTISIQVLKQGTVTKADNYHDGSCSVDDQKGILSLGALLNRIR